MRVQLKESIRMNNLILSRRGFLAGLSSLLAAPAVVRAEALMPIKVWRPPLIWRDGLIAANGVELAIADFPDLFTIFGYMHGGCGPKFRLYDYTPSNSMWYIAPRVTDDEWPFMRQAYCMPPNRRTSKRCMRSVGRSLKRRLFLSTKQYQMNFERD
jgi:hypothetical protein